MARILIVVAVLILFLVVAPRAYSQTGADDAGTEFGLHHATHAQTMGGFTGDHNPGVLHEGFSGWHDH